MATHDHGERTNRRAHKNHHALTAVLRPALLALAIGLLPLSAPSLAVAQTAQTPQTSGIESTIRAQIEAFRRDDGPAAFAFASPTIQGQFQTPERFLDMVRRGYAPVYRPQSIRFLGLEEQGGRLVQRVLLAGPDGALVTAVYAMVMIDGAWRIDGCWLERADEGV